MRLAFNSAVPIDSVRPPLRERATSFVLAVAVTLLMILGLLSLNGSARGPQFKGSPTIVFFTPDAETADATPKQARSQPEAAAKPTTPPPPPIPVPPPPPVPMPVPFFIHLAPQEIAAADISSIHHPELAGHGTAQASASAASGDSRPVGTAPNGEPLYEAEWYRHPTHAELSFYLPHMTSDGWGLIACKTVAGHHVEDCVELGSSPGSHLAGAVRQAAWQFLVRAPRRGGRELVGSWVRIRIDYVAKLPGGAEKPDDAPASGD